MAKIIQVRGVKEAMASLRRVKARHARQCQRGLIKAGLVVQRQSQLIVPVDVGNLKASAFTRAEGRGFTTQVIVGYTAAYAIFVHEDTDKAHGEEYNRKYANEIAAKEKYWYFDYKLGFWFLQTYHLRGPDQKSKFLEDVLRAHRHDLVQIVLWEMRKSK